MKAFKTGMVSVTFRNYSPEEVVTATKKAGLDGIEWGGDVHVPHGDIKTAERIGLLTREAGLEVISYGSYYRAGTYGSHEAAKKEYMKMIDTASALGTGHIRVWAGNSGSVQMTAEDRANLVSEMVGFGRAAAERKISVSFEYHQGTLTDDPESAKKLIEEIGCDNVNLYWQPNQFKDPEFNLAALEKVLNYITNVHVFAWEGSGRYLLSNPVHLELWKKYLSILKNGKKHSLLLEFSHDGSEEAFLSDADTLKALII